MTKVVTQAELNAHSNPEKGLWLAIDHDVYDVSKFGRIHPGGYKVLANLAGKDVTEEFYELHRKSVLTKYKRLIVGRLEGAPDKPASLAQVSRVPFAELPVFQGMHSPYYKDSHRKFLIGFRDYVKRELEPVAQEMDMEGEYPDKDFKKSLGMEGIIVSRMGPGPWMKHVNKLGIKLPGGIAPEEFDYFHEMIAHQETFAIGLPGFNDCIATGQLISAPAIWHFGNEEMKATVGEKAINGDLNTCLAISEPFAGSDVANIRTTAVRTPDGKHFIVNGVKKWITEGCYADYFVTAVRTGEAGGKGLSLLLIPRCEGMETKQIKTTYSTCTGTALVIYEDVKVPVENIMGKEGEGFKLIMYNFNHERWLIVNQIMGMARAALADAFMWAAQRKVFGKPLIEQAVIRNKLSSSAAALESVQAYLDAITYDMSVSKDGPVGTRLAGPIAMLKYQSTRMGWQIADDTVQIMGGRGITRTGMGSRVEGFKNYVKYAAVYGGSEEIMADLAIKQALKAFPADISAKL
eukprot:gnl/TRDRNA2_/TRDRNA2_84761_c0_seq1.p1 gnl/TRDRNA2_/TRDRNA2_84761_c0~~gnl/TRDRNA2_/TRDRNA2_84761_c0_seq1.p1  ORF type:complete len:520 (-),score=130.03 gnl/TRDRNA2_/TRDRNA2_84761_c0_seq1:123-1682(-)